MLREFHSTSTLVLVRLQETAFLECSFLQIAGMILGHHSRPVKHPELCHIDQSGEESMVRAVFKARIAHPLYEMVHPAPSPKAESECSVVAPAVLIAAVCPVESQVRCSVTPVRPDDEDVDSAWMQNIMFVEWDDGSTAFA